MKPENNSVLYSMLLSMNNIEEHELTYEDLRYAYHQRVNQCQIKLYTLVIERLSQGMSYEQVNEFLDNIDMKEFSISDDQKSYVKARIKRDLNSRKINEQRNKGEIDYE